MNIITLISTGLVRWFCVMVGSRAVTVAAVLLMAAVTSAWSAAIAAESGANADERRPPPPSYADLSIAVEELMSALENGTDDARVQALIDDLQLRPEQQLYQQERARDRQQQLQSRRFRHEASAVRILYQIGVSRFSI